MASRQMGIDTEVLEKFLDGSVDLSKAQARQMEKLLKGWKTAGWIIEQQKAARKLDEPK